MITKADLVREGLPVVESVSHRLARRLGHYVHLDDLKGIGRLALLDVVRSYDTSHGDFATYAAPRLKWAIFDEVRRQTHVRADRARLNALIASERIGESITSEWDSASKPTNPEQLPTLEEWQARFSTFLQRQAAALAVGLATGPMDMVHLADEVATPEEQTARAETAQDLRNAVKMLPEREQKLITRHYFDGERFDVIAEDLGISKSWASRLHERAISTLAKALR